MTTQAQSGIPFAIHRQLCGALAATLVLGFGVGGWAATTRLAGAVIAPGSLVVNSNLKKVQHPTGGVVGNLLVRDGDVVRAGDLLLRLDETVTRANLAIVVKLLDELAARQSRLEAERDGEVAITFPADLQGRTSNPDVARVVNGERRLFEIRGAARDGNKQQLRERIGQLEEQMRGMEEQIQAKQSEIELIHRE